MLLLIDVYRQRISIETRWTVGVCYARFSCSSNFFLLLTVECLDRLDFLSNRHDRRYWYLIDSCRVHCFFIIRKREFSFPFCLLSTVIETRVCRNLMVDEHRSSSMKNGKQRTSCRSLFNGNKWHNKSDSFVYRSSLWHETVKQFAWMSSIVHSRLWQAYCTNKCQSISRNWTKKKREPLFDMSVMKHVTIFQWSCSINESNS
jgi:hypothetical protein